MTVLLLSEERRADRDVLVLGSGVIGGAIAERLRRRLLFSAVELEVSWGNGIARRNALREVQLLLERRVRARPVSVVWAAGRAGFSASEAEAAEEMDAYRDVIALVQGLRESAPSVPHRFHLISSAGGLFEGCAVRSATDEPAPLRAYGRLKLAQEQEALSRLSASGLTIYRPSSVYAPSSHGARSGLIGTLVGNGLARRTTAIVGSLRTLRDYVMAADVGAYVGDRALNDVDDAGAAHMLVSGRPASILQVITQVESVIRQRLYVRIAEAWNSRDISFSPAVKSAGFRSTPLAVGIRVVYSATLGRPMGVS